MSEGAPAETPALGRYCCPGCEPEADPLAEILIINACEFHKPDLSGLDDRLVEAPVGMLGNSQTDGITQRGMARLLR